MTDDSKQSEGSEGVEKRIASVLSSLSLSRLLHIHDFMSSVHNCSSCVRWFGYVVWWRFLKLGVVCKQLMVDRMTGHDVRKWSSAQDTTSQ